LIGNDIIDLSLAETESNWQRKGFLEKQFTANEQAIIFDRGNSLEKVWRLWSMKESAYKIYTQQNEQRFFAPKKFECQLTSEDEGIVFFKDQKFYTSSIINESYIFTLATFDKNLKSDTLIGSPSGINKDIKNKLEEVTGFQASEIEQKKSKNGAPNYYHNNKQITKSCSISHHGNYGVFSLLYN
jgi:phosphopantetheinyl transferase (holo-ACP synthase)